MSHDFKLFPELTNNQLQFYYFISPHRQITEDFEGRVVKITDGDTIHIKWSEREKPIRVRFIENQAPEMDQIGGIESRAWLESKIMGEHVLVEIDPAFRVGKWGRILGRINHMGIDINQLSMDMGFSHTFGEQSWL